MPTVEYMKNLYKDDPKSFIITNNQGLIKFCNKAWIKTCGFEESEILNKTNKFLQGPLTEREEIYAINQAIKYRIPFTTTITNYKKNGSAFKNCLTIEPLEDGYCAEILDMGKSNYEILYDLALKQRS